ncbi:MAG: hypothetical protein D3921_00650 [Candidatus Electrothrix sp. AW1]|nr:hypothetical protein [Candidatus Electrothrix gigas]
MSNTLTLKPYIELVRTHCHRLSSSQLIDLLCSIAQEVPTKERQSFLEKLEITATIPSDPSDSAEEVEDILERIADIIEEILERQESIEDGSYYEIYEDYSNYYDDEPEIMSPEQQKELEEIFAEADQLFLAGELASARKVYQQLFSIFLHSSELKLYYEINRQDIDINWQETLARYCRSVYETVATADRTQQVLDAMEVDYPVAGQYDDPYEKWLPSLQDVYNARPEDISEWDDFLQGIQTALQRKRDNRAVLLCLEAIYLTDSLQGLATAVRQKKSPVGYLYWVNQLEEEALWEETAQAALEALDSMPPDRLRTAAATALIRAGQQTEKKDFVLHGKQEQFFSEPNGQHLDCWLEEARKQEAKEEMLHTALAFLNNRLEGSQKDTSWQENRFFLLKIKVLLLLGRLEDAFAEIDGKAVVGWSNSKQTTAIVYTCVLLALVRCSVEARTIHDLFSGYLALSNEKTITDEILQHLAKADAAAQEEWFQFAERMTQARIDHIVSNKYRKAYARAAEVLGGYMEALILNDRKDQAVEFLHLNRNQKYNRFSAFRAEIQRVTGRSPLLAGL